MYDLTSEESQDLLLFLSFNFISKKILKSRVFIKAVYRFMRKVKTV